MVLILNHTLTSGTLTSESMLCLFAYCTPNAESLAAWLYAPMPTMVAIDAIGTRTTTTLAHPGEIFCQKSERAQT